MYFIGKIKCVIQNHLFGFFNKNNFVFVFEEKIIEFEMDCSNQKIM